MFLLLLFIYFIFYVFYYYKKNFLNFNQFISYIFKNIIIFIGYKITNEIYIEKLPSRLILIGTHTSIYDFFIGTLIYYAYLHEKYDTYVLMKKEFETFTKPIMNILDKRFKLISIDSSKKNNGITNTICNELENKDNYILFIAPEGTRKYTEKIRTGYWIISKNLNIDILYIGVDFSNKKIVFENFRKPFLSWEEEEKEFGKCCKKYIPLYPERCYWTKDYYQ